MASINFGSSVVLRALALVTCLSLPAVALAGEAEPLSGKDLFLDRCASCHGADAIGNGPAASALKLPPANLTEIAKRAGGTFPAARVVEIITYGGDIAAHGSGPMPVWGKVFSDEGGRGRIGAANSRRSVIALKRYLETVQK
jgi:mono/diheme cytochrome c family protein